MGKTIGLYNPMGKTRLDYKFFDVRRSFNKAVEYCKNEGMQMATFRSNDEYIKFNQKLNRGSTTKQDYWIGGRRDPLHTGTFSSGSWVLTVNN